MKTVSFDQIPVGDLFLWRGDEWTKISETEAENREKAWLIEDMSEDIEGEIFEVYE